MTMDFPKEIASIQYLKWDTLYQKEKPFQVFRPIPPSAKDQRETNLIFEHRDVEFHNVRNREEKFELDTHGFMFRDHRIELSCFANKQAIEALYLPQVEDLLKRELDQVDHVRLVSWRLRHGIAPTKDGTIDLQDPSDPLRPSNYAHVDVTPISVINRVRETFPSDHQSILSGRVRFINIWRPIARAVEDWPLAVCDGTTVKPSSFVEADLVRRDAVSSNLFLTYNKDHKWYYIDKHRVNEVLIFKQFDTSTDVKARCCPHGSFKHGTFRRDAPPRESIEVRALVFTKAPLTESNAEI